MFIALTAAFVLPDLPHNTRGFTAEELEVAQLRMIEDVGEADEDAKDAGTFDGLFMALKDTKLYIMSLTFTAYVVGLSFNAYFVRRPSPGKQKLLVTSNANVFPTAHAHANPRLRLCSDPAHERSPLGLLLHRLAHCGPSLGPHRRKGMAIHELSLPQMPWAV